MRFERICLVRSAKAEWRNESPRYKIFIAKGQAAMFAAITAAHEVDLPDRNFRTVLCELSIQL
ncbi:hypothetical protein CN311_16005 [Mesorhizobium sanjuanii]|uniref:Uncharacterized protein n=1 Tax=Mesorhizobium sanjuanii TaxID=2037900 RepID=A0A2A6FDS4_9HYPH|nr:hypothetical protein CN311_16005 [Mesorhizobium sanjuanii]